MYLFIPNRIYHYILKTSTGPHHKYSANQPSMPLPTQA
uniref:Uncharacterized protein n=1 Tax=Anguilla anguilla TaxID=7936 RepID=A0A0E9UAA7_ANGAN